MKTPNVTILGYRNAKEITGADPTNPTARIEDLVSATGLQRIAKSRPGKEGIQQYGATLGLCIKKMIQWEYWKGIERLYIGGGISIGETGLITLESAKTEISRADLDLTLMPHDPNDAGLLGSIYPIMKRFKDFNTIVGIDLGGTNIRVGIVHTNEDKQGSQVTVSQKTTQQYSTLNIERDDVINLIAKQVSESVKHIHGEERAQLHVSMACPGTINSEGYITAGASNLPGNWTQKGFHAPTALKESLAKHKLSVCNITINNDAVLHGLSVIPHLGNISEWGIVTLGTGVGNARLTRRIQ